jgi:hypothetical protein
MERGGNGRAPERTVDLRSASVISMPVVRRGPATQPQPVYEVRRANAELRVRRVEPRSLRVNPVHSCAYSARRQ